LKKREKATGGDFILVRDQKADLKKGKKMY